MTAIRWRRAARITLPAMLALAGASGAVPRSRSDVAREEIGAATAVVRVIRAPPVLAPGGPIGSEGGRFVNARLVRIIPLQGNNFLNQREPINNRDGRIIGEGAGTTGSTGVSGCSGETVSFGPSATAPPDFRFAGIEINPNTGACRLRSDGSSGLAVIFQSPADGGTDPTRVEFFTDTLEAIWTMIDPAPLPGGIIIGPGTVQSITIRATTGLTVRITFVVNGTLPTNYMLTVQQIQSL